MTDLFDLQRFVDAQAPVHPRVLAELGQGQKQSHWMWFIFPQLAGLGHSPMAQRFAIASREEAAAYLDHDVLGPRLRECTTLVNAVQGRTIREILGSPDGIREGHHQILWRRARPKDAGAAWRLELPPHKIFVVPAKRGLVGNGFWTNDLSVCRQLSC